MLYDWTAYIYQIRDDELLAFPSLCGKMILTDCDGIHYYEDPCTIVSDCLDNLGRPTIDRCEMVNEIPGAVPGAFLRVDLTGNCVEWIDPDTVFGNYNTDAKVAVNAGCVNPDGTGEYLEDILISDGSITISTVGCQLMLSTNGVESFLDLNDTPNSYVGHDGDILKVSGNSVVFVPDDKTQRVVRYLDGNQTLPSQLPSNIKRYPCACSAWEGNAAMVDQGVYDGSTYYVIRIQKTGMYHVWFNGGLRFNTGVGSIKMSVMTNEGGDKSIILSAKNGTIALGGGPRPIVDKDSGEGEKRYNYSEKGLFKLSAGTLLFFMVRVDSGAGTGDNAEVEVEGQTLYSGSLLAPGADDWAYKYCGSQFGVARYSEVTHNAV